MNEPPLLPQELTSTWETFRHALISIRSQRCLRPAWRCGHGAAERRDGRLKSSKPKSFWPSSAPLSWWWWGRVSRARSGSSEAAGLVRYRAKIDDPKDAGVMLSTLGVGLACGVGQFPVAVFAAGFIIAALWVIEWFEPRPVKPFVLEVKTKESAKVQPKVEELLRRRRLKFELRAASPEEFSYAVQLPADPRTDALSSANIALDKDPGTAVNWEPNKTPKS